MFKFAAICNVWFAKMANLIQHRGIVENIDGTHLSVKIVQTTACASCTVKGHCSSAESKEKIIDVYDTSGHSYAIGDKVMVVGQTSMGMQAVLLAFVIPFIIMLVALFICMAIFEDELIAGCVSLSLLIPYYFVLWLNKTRLKQKFSFTIKPIK